MQALHIRVTLISGRSLSGNKGMGKKGDEFPLSGTDFLFRKDNVIKVCTLMNATISFERSIGSFLCCTIESK